MITEQTFFAPLCSVKIRFSCRCGMAMESATQGLIHQQIAALRNHSVSLPEAMEINHEILFHSLCRLRRLEIHQKINIVHKLKQKTEKAGN